MRDGHESSVAPAQPKGRSRLTRLTKRAEFQAVARGRRFHTTCLTAQGLRREVDGTSAQADGTTSAGGLRVGLTVTKREGRATERNRIKRRLRTAVAEAATPFVASDLDVVLVGRRSALSAPFSQLVADIGRALPSLAKATGKAASTASNEPGARLKPGSKGRSTRSGAAKQAAGSGPSPTNLKSR